MKQNQQHTKVNSRKLRDNLFYKAITDNWGFGFYECLVGPMIVLGPMIG